MDQSKAEAALRKARRLAPGQAEAEARRQLSGAEFTLEAPALGNSPRSVAEDISRRLSTVGGEPTGEDRVLWER